MASFQLVLDRQEIKSAIAFYTANKLMAETIDVTNFEGMEDRLKVVLQSVDLAVVVINAKEESE